MPIITIDGNIGCGKTTILNYLHKNHNISIDLEPVEQWKPYLENMYRNKEGTFNFQLRVWLDRAWIQEKEDKVLILMERSPDFIKNTFNKAAYTNNLINENEYNILTELFNKTDNVWKCNNYIYIRSDPKKCIERINNRNREGENEINLDYINILHEYHEETYKNAINNNLNIKMIDIEDKTTEETCNMILEYIKNDFYLNLN